MRTFKVMANKSGGLKVKTYVINKGQTGQYYGLKNAEDNQVLYNQPNGGWKTEKGAIRWAEKQGYEVVNASAAANKYRIDIYKVNNPDALIKREYKMFDSEDEAKKYGESIADGNEVVVNLVKASTDAVKAARNSKTIKELVLQGNYGYGWDDLVSYDDTPEGRKEMKDDYRAYLENEKNGSFRTIERRVPNPDYKAPADRFRVTPYTGGFVYKDGDTKKFTDIEDAVNYAEGLDKECVLKDVVTGYSVQISKGAYSADRNAKNIQRFYDVVGESVEASTKTSRQFTVKASSITARDANVENITKRVINELNDKRLTRAYENNDITIQLIEGKDVMISTEGPNRDNLYDIAKEAITETYPEYDVVDNWGDMKRKGYSDRPISSSKKSSKKFTVKASWDSVEDELKEAKISYNADFSEGPYACAEIDGKGYIYQKFPNIDGKSMVMRTNVEKTYDFALEQVKKFNRDYLADSVWEAQHGVESSTVSKRKFTVKASSDGWKETDYSVFMDGGRQLMSKYTKEFDGYRVMILPEYNAKTDILSWVVFLFDVDEEPRRLEAFETAYDAKDFADYEVYEGYVKPVNGACGKKSVRASRTAKRIAKSRIAASDYRDEDIVMYFNGDNVYTGSIYDSGFVDAVENLCYDDEVNAKFQEWCNQFGDPFDFDGSPIDTASVFTDIIIHEADEAPETENNGSQFYEDGNGILNFEIFYANDGIYSAKSIKCSSSDNFSDFDETMRFRVCSYFDNYYRSIDECKVFDDFDEAVDFAHECLGKGPTTIEDYEIGTLKIDPDEYWENFDGEFWCMPELAEFRDEVWKSLGIGASTNIKAGLSLNLNAKPNYTDWMLRGYKFNGEDVTTQRIDFQDDVKQAVMDMFSDPDIETIDLYKIPTEQDTTGVFEDEEYFETISRDDLNKTDAFAAVECAITNPDSRDYRSNPIYELNEYVAALADGVIRELPNLTYEITDEAITFTDSEGNVIYIQSVDGITPEPDDLENDIIELAGAIESEDFYKQSWETQEDDPDYATRAIEFSEDYVDELEPVMGDGEDYGFGFDSNGDPIDESTVEELYRIAEQDILPTTKLAEIDEYVSIDEDSWKFYMSSPYVGVDFYIHFKLTQDDINLNDYVLADASMVPDFNYYTADLDFDIYSKDGEIIDVVLEEAKIYKPDGAYADYYEDKFNELYNTEGINNFVKNLAKEAVEKIYNGVTNL